MDQLQEALKLMGLGIGAVFGLMIGISAAMWMMGRVFVFFEGRAQQKSEAKKSAKHPSGKLVQGSAR